MSKSH